MSKKKEEKPKKHERKIRKISEAEYEKRIVELAKEGLTSEKIGEKLRQEGIHTKNHSKKVSKVLKDNNLHINADLKNIEAKLERVVKHYEKNKQDKRAMREKDRIAAQLRKTKTYLKIESK